IGRGIANTELYVLGARRELLPIGQPGELYIGGAGVARGYLNRPELTAQRFVPNPYGSGTLYKTGDLVRYRSDGNLDYLGRLDHQVKVRGYRIELGEIETRLTDHPAVREAVVVAQESQDGSKTLVGYIVGEQDVSITGLGRYLECHLPAYMVPAVLVPLEAMPLTPNGKIDRQALPWPVGGETPGVPGENEPLSALEQSVAKVWMDVLGVERVGLNDHFFHLGGHSLKA
ncbi:non-ribosomal peptide synthetase, partial [Deinococcus multiflagellatus]|uniref:non-ribosomal peptide synthetase n=1 Tax=Deinococcus multiflagellatus TaxID=1656887 RepID=UPI001CCD84A9